MRVVCGCVQSVKQVAFADIILLNKSDLVTQDDKKRVTARIKVRCSLYNPVYQLCCPFFGRCHHLRATGRAVVANKDIEL